MRERIEYDIADGRTVAGAGKAVSKPPILERVRRRPFSRGDVGEDLYCRAGPSRRGHPVKAMVRRAATMIHISANPMAPTRNTGARAPMRLVVRWI